MAFMRIHTFGLERNEKQVLLTHSYITFGLGSSCVSIRLLSSVFLRGTLSTDGSCEACPASFASVPQRWLSDLV